MHYWFKLGAARSSFFSFDTYLFVSESRSSRTINTSYVAKPESSQNKDNRNFADQSRLNILLRLKNLFPSCPDVFFLRPRI